MTDSTLKHSTELDKSTITKRIEESSAKNSPCKDCQNGAWFIRGQTLTCLCTSMKFLSYETETLQKSNINYCAQFIQRQ